MLRVTLRSFWEHKRRLISTDRRRSCSASPSWPAPSCSRDTLDKVFDDLFAEGNANVDAQVQGEVLFSDPFAGGDQRRLLDADARRRGRRRATGCAEAEPSRRHPRLRQQQPRARPRRRAHRLVERPADAPRELDPGQQPHRLQRRRGPRDRRPTTRWRSTSPRRTTPASRWATPSPSSPSSGGTRTTRSSARSCFGTAESSGGAVSVELHPGRGAAHRRHRRAHPDRAGRRRARASASSSSPTPSPRWRLPDDVEVLTGQEAAAQLSSDVQEGFAFFQQALIHLRRHRPAGRRLRHLQHLLDPRSQQRTRELALLRAVGAGRAPGARLGDARGGPRRARLRRPRSARRRPVGQGRHRAPRRLRRAISPTTTLVVSTSTVVIALAHRPGRHPDRRRDPRRSGPPGCLRSPRSATSPSTAPARRRAASCSAIIVLVLGAVNLLRRTGPGTATPTPSRPVGLGALLIIVGAIIIGPVLAEPEHPGHRRRACHASRASRASSPPRTRLGARSARRPPPRPSSSAWRWSAFITVFAASATESVTAEVDRGFLADFVVQSEGGSLRTARRLPGLGRRGGRRGRRRRRRGGRRLRGRPVHLPGRQGRHAGPHVGRAGRHHRGARPAHGRGLDHRPGRRGHRRRRGRGRGPRRLASATRWR